MSEHGDRVAFLAPARRGLARVAPVAAPAPVPEVRPTDLGDDLLGAFVAAATAAGAEVATTPGSTVPEALLERYVRARLARPVSLAELAEATATTSRTLSRRLVAATGMARDRTNLPPDRLPIQGRFYIWRVLVGPTSGPSLAGGRRSRSSSSAGRRPHGGGALWLAKHRPELGGKIIGLGSR